MTVSILGCGWFGLPLAKAFIAKGVRVKGSGTSKAKLTLLEASGVVPFLINLSEEGAVYPQVFFLCDILLIAVPPKIRSGEGELYVPKLKGVISAIHQHHIKKVILISSTGVYGDQNREVDESTDPQPDSQGGRILFEAEELFKQQTTFKTTIIRFGGLLGPGRDPGRFFAGRKDIANGLAPVNMIHLDDCIGLTLAIIAKDAFGYTFNACTPHHPAKGSFYTKAAQWSGLELPRFLHELKEWKTVNSVNIEPVLGYRFIINNWNAWFNEDS